MLTRLFPSVETGVLVFFSPADFIVLFFGLPPAMSRTMFSKAPFRISSTIQKIEANDPRSLRMVTEWFHKAFSFCEVLYKVTFLSFFLFVNRRRNFIPAFLNDNNHPRVCISFCNIQRCMTFLILQLYLCAEDKNISEILINYLPVILHVWRCTLHSGR